jgi:hypothetical protein
VLGGVLSHVWGGWLDLNALWVAEPFREEGHGTKLLRAAEDEARMQGCHGVFLTTFSFQANPFYEKFGYEVIAAIPDYPKGHSYHVLKRRCNRAVQKMEPLPKSGFSFFLERSKQFVSVTGSSRRLHTSCAEDIEDEALSGSRNGDDVFFFEAPR